MRGRKTPYGCVAFVVIALTVGITILQEEKAKKERNGNKHAIESPARMVSDSMTIGNMPHQTKEKIPAKAIAMTSAVTIPVSAIEAAICSGFIT